jgi:hypothetical protein
MPDRLFFPLALLLAAAFVFIALRPFDDRAPRGPVSGGGRNPEDVTVTGTELHRFLAGKSPGLSITTDEAGETVARINRLADEAYEDPRYGPHIMLAEDLEFAFESRPVEVTIEARGAGEFAASQFQADYMARADAESGWQTFNLTPDFAPYSFSWTTPKRGSTEGYDYIGVRPIAPDKRRAMEIRSIRIHALGPKELPPLDAPASPIP